MRHTLYIYIVLPFAMLFAGCRTTPDLPKGDITQVKGRNGFYLLCEGNMGSNKATIDYYDARYDTLYRNIYPAMNPSVVQALGDVGNDICAYGSKIYATINCSALLEVMDRDGRHLTKIDIPNCRDVVAHDGYVYVTSYAGPIDMSNPAYEQRGYVARIDTSTLTITDTCIVGFQPDGMAVVDDHLYVANSGGYMAPNYDSTLSVIRLSDFREVRRITVAVNLYRVLADQRGMLWVTSRGDYMQAPEMLYRVNPQNGDISPMGFGATTLCMQGDSLYFFSTEYSAATHKYQKTFGIFNTLTAERVSSGFITDGSETQIQRPYGLYVDAATHEIFVTDARDYTTPGVLMHYSADGKLLRSWRTGDIPGHFAILHQ